MRSFSAPGVGVWPLVIATLIAGCGDPAPTTVLIEPLADEPPCTAPAPSGEALLPAGPAGEGTWVLLDGSLLRPAGRQVELAVTFPWGLAVGGDRAYVTTAGSGQDLLVVDLTAGAIVQRVREPRTSHGIALSPDGLKLYVAGGASRTVWVYDVTAGGLAAAGSIERTGYLSGLALTPDGGTLLVLDNTASTLEAMNPDGSGLRTIKVGNYPYDLAVGSDGATVWVTNWSGGTVSAVDLAAGTQIAEIAVGKNPAGLALSPDGATLYVANTDSSTISVIETAGRRVTTTVPLDPDAAGLTGYAPTHIAVHPDGTAVFVTLSDHNAIAVFDPQGMVPLGMIPTGKYPARVAIAAEGARLVVVNAHGNGSIPNDSPRAHPAETWPGTLSIIDTPDAAGLAAHTAVVEQNDARAKGFYGNTECGRIVPLPASEGDRSPIEHVVLIVKENKTYDEVLGDLTKDGQPYGNGDPSLTLFGEAITPNVHNLAREFVNADNFYSNADESIQGHLWLTQADCNDFLNKCRFDQLPLPGVDPSTRVETGTVFRHFLDHGLTVRNYGEIVNFFDSFTNEGMQYIDTKFPFWTMGVWDVDKAREFIREMNNGIFPNFIFLSLPNDHTYGGDAGKPSPRYLVADNDHGLGMVVEAISRSRYWEKTAIFILEDDPQSAAGDHVDAHRSILVVVSPWVKRGHLTSVHYDYSSVWRTIELILGVPPINRNTATAAPMYDIFTGVPDYTPYTRVKPDVPFELNPEGTKAAELSKKYDWSQIDGHKGLGDIIWMMMRPGQKRPAHAKVIVD